MSFYDDQDYYDRKKEEQIADDMKRAQDQYNDPRYNKYHQQIDFEKLSDITQRLKDRKHSRKNNQNVQDNKEAEESNKTYQKFRNKLNRFLDGNNDDDDEDYTQNVRSSRWIYRAYYNANNPRSFIGRWLRFLNKGYVTSAFDANEFKKDGTPDTGDKSKYDLDQTVNALKRKANGINNFSIILMLLGLAGFVLIIPRFSIISCVLGLALWLICMFCMSLTVSYNMLAIKLTSRLRMATRGKKKKKIVISREEIVNEQFVQAERMIRTLVNFFIDSCLIGINFFAFPVIFQATNYGKQMKGYGFNIDPAFMHSFLGTGTLAHIFLLVAPLIMGYTMRRDLEDNMSLFKETIFTFLNAHRYRVRPLHNLIQGERPPYEANITIGRSLITGDDVVLPVKDRANGTLITGVNGAGKSGSIYKPWIAQDLLKFVRWFRKLPTLIQRPDYFSKKVAAKYLNGIVVMDTTNDLCFDTYCIAHDDLGIPDEMIRYLNPGDPDSDTINLMRGPAQGVANMITSCFNALSDQKNGNDFFIKSQQEWLHEYILLVKHASTLMEYPVSFSDLFNVCLNTSYVDRYTGLLDVYENILRKVQALYYLYARKHKDLQVEVDPNIEQDIEQYRETGSEAFKQAMKLAEDHDDVQYHEDVLNDINKQQDSDFKLSKSFIAKEQVISNLINYDYIVNTPRISKNLSIPFSEISNDYGIVHTNNNWFKTSVVKLHDVPDKAANGDTKKSADQKLIETLKKEKTAYKRGDWVYFDQKETYVTGMRVILGNLASNKYVRRIFFNEKENDNFSIDNFFHAGGLLLMYTGKGEKGMSAEDTRVIASIMQKLIISASQRRKVDDGGPAEPLIPFYFDEHIDYMTEEFVKFTGQVRKYNISVLTIVQSYHQVADQFGKEFLGVLLSTMRGKLVFDDAEADDAEYMSKMFGKHPALTKTYQSTQVNGPHNDRASLRVTPDFVPNITPEQIVEMQPYTLAVRYDFENEPIPYDHVQVSQVDHKKLHNSPLHIDIERNEQDLKAFEVYRSTQTAQNPDFDGISLIIHEYFIRVNNYYKNNQHDVYRDADENYSFNHEVDTLSENVKKTLSYAEQYGITEDAANYTNLLQQDTYVKGVPDWIFEEFRDGIFEKHEDEESGSLSKENDVDITGNQWDVPSPNDSDIEEVGTTVDSSDEEAESQKENSSIQTKEKSEDNDEGEDDSQFEEVDEEDLYDGCEEVEEESEE